MGKDIYPIDYLKIGNDCAFKLIEFFLKDIHQFYKIINENNNYKWGKRKTKREDLKSLCTLDWDMDKEEIIKRERACNFPNYNNMLISINQNLYQLKYKNN